MERESIQHWIHRMEQLPDCRDAKIQAIKEEIKRGSYVTEEKIKEAYKKLLEDIPI